MSGVIILWSALIGASAALIVVVLHRIVAQKRAAIDLLWHMRTDSDLLAGRQMLRSLAQKGELNRIIEPKTDGDTEARLKVQTYLNTLELVCVAIKRHVIDEDICADLIQNTITRTWQLVEHLTDTIRDKEKNDSYYTALQFVATKWLANEKCSEDHKIVSAIKEVWPFRRADDKAGSMLTGDPPR